MTNCDNMEQNVPSTLFNIRHEEPKRLLWGQRQVLKAGKLILSDKSLLTHCSMKLSNISIFQPVEAV